MTYADEDARENFQKKIDVASLKSDAMAHAVSALGAVLVFLGFLAQKFC
jgi:hypothetical protein